MNWGGLLGFDEDQGGVVGGATGAGVLTDGPEEVVEGVVGRAVGEFEQERFDAFAAEALAAGFMASGRPSV